MRNVLTAWHSTGGYEGYPFKFNVSSPLPINWVYLYHNTCRTNAAEQSAFLFKQYSNWTNVVSRNNIYAGTDYAMLSSSSTNPVDFDYDDLYTSKSGSRIYWEGTRYVDIASFCSATSQECHGVSVAPEFADTASYDFRLVMGNGCIDKGCLVPGVNNEYGGAAPDLGAVESDLAPTRGTSRPGFAAAAPGPRPVFRREVIADGKGARAMRRGLTLYDIRGQRIVAGKGVGAAVRVVIGK
jgi:hypothetical protein